MTSAAVLVKLYMPHSERQCKKLFTSHGSLYGVYNCDYERVNDLLLKDASVHSWAAGAATVENWLLNSTVYTDGRSFCRIRIYSWESPCNGGGGREADVRIVIVLYDVARLGDVCNSYFACIVCSHDFSCLGSYAIQMLLMSFSE
jgi:hypothetical protein